MAVDTLPPELLMRILELLESTADLYSVISASPAALRIFETASERVLLTVTRRRIHPQSLRHAVATISVPSVNFKPPWNVLDRYFSSGSEPSEDALLAPGKARALATLHAHVCRHIRRYADQTCAQLSGPATDGGQQLSSTELTRLERGFYRYELYCRVFPAEPGNALQSRSSAREQFERFIKRLEPWEMEEIVCIHQYFVYHLGTIVDDLESQLVTRFLANACREPPVGDAQQVLYYDELDMREMTLFSTEARKDSPHNLGYIAASGLAFMNSVFHATTSTERLDLIRSHGPGTRELLADALYRGAEEIPHPPISRDFSGDDPSLPNLGYLQYAPDVTTIYMQIREDDIRWLPMRLLGYVFWDSDRLENPLARSVMEQGQGMSMRELRQRFDRSKQPSAEARLDGFRVRRDVMDDLVRDYASTLVLFPPIDEVEEVEHPGAGM
ncbi:uncharacterized protein F5Z01DRAFT_636741 [Emericellopsis atlantica]|uniref:F-box domain-containing protein n=1 Tax=Emericellopsis atlantica TaxID=2614577 RepID=A0A9P7ZL24_9HYPO|nr:uncharacterized protein F5Z01DRAFT_636741 [Emericellopsis atlantica]KAG9254079.1 hypothetical protein F5Z01DRAFT_636741 [Emericellopsis atlantica]